MRIPVLSIPAFDDLDDEIGTWVWSKLGDFSHRVFIEHQRGHWLAGTEKNGECIIAAMWAENADGGIGALIGVTGKLAAHVNSSLTDGEKTERIWKYLGAQSILMTHLPIRPRNEWRLK